MVPALERGNFDMILNGLEITDEHRRQIAMSRPYYAYAQQIVVRKGTQGVTRLDRQTGRAFPTLALPVHHHRWPESGEEPIGGTRRQPRVDREHGIPGVPSSAQLGHERRTAGHSQGDK